MSTKHFRSGENSSTAHRTLMNRRSFLCTSLCAAAGLLLPGSVLATPAPPKTLCFHHTHTGERMEIDYRPGGYSGKVRRSLEYFLRDFRTGEQHAFDPALFDSLYTLQNRCGSPVSIEVVSAYRSPTTNAYLRKKSNGVARKSLHMQGRAIDLRVSELSTRVLRDLALKNHDGGVGYYPKSDFIHLDTGRKRSW